MKLKIKIIITILITIFTFLMSVISSNKLTHNHKEVDVHEVTEEQITEDTIEQTLHTENYEQVEEPENDETEVIEIMEENTIDTNLDEVTNEAETKEVIEETTEAVVEETTEEATEEVASLVSLGKFKLTAYCSCIKCCGQYAANRPKDEDGNDIVYGSIGIRLIEGVSIAVDPNIIPYESEVIIDEHTYLAHDTGGKIKGNRIDVYFENHNEALKFGVRYAEVFAKM